jgi:hypothetical protein
MLNVHGAGEGVRTGGILCEAGRRQRTCWCEPVSNPACNSVARGRTSSAWGPPIVLNAKGVILLRLSRRITRKLGATWCVDGI